MAGSRGRSPHLLHELLLLLVGKSNGLGDVNGNLEGRTVASDKDNAGQDCVVDKLRDITARSYPMQHRFCRIWNTVIANMGHPMHQLRSESMNATYLLLGVRARSTGPDMRGQ